MKKYIALLRGINVGGQKKIKMQELRVQLAASGLEHVITYIQSGNLVFKSTMNSKEVRDHIEQQLHSAYGFEVPTIIREPDELSAVIQANPFLKDSEKSVDRLYLTVLDEIPTNDLVAKLNELDFSPEAFSLDGKNIYFHSPLGYGKAKMNNNFFENKLKVKATTRNWKTANKLVELAAEMD